MWERLSEGVGWRSRRRDALLGAERLKRTMGWPVTMEQAAQTLVWEG